MGTQFLKVSGMNSGGVDFRSRDGGASFSSGKKARTVDGVSCRLDGLHGKGLRLKGGMNVLLSSSRRRGNPLFSTCEGRGWSFNLRCESGRATASGGAPLKAGTTGAASAKRATISTAQPLSTGNGEFEEELRAASYSRKATGQGRRGAASSYTSQKN